MAATACQACGAPIDQPRCGRRKWCSERCRKSQYAGSCIDCGAPTNGTAGGHKRTPERCVECGKRHSAEVAAEFSVLYREMVEEMWAEGMTCREIADALGWKTKNVGTHISVMRARGYNLPHRRTPEQLARITKGCEKRLAKARAAYAEMREAA